MQPRPGLPQGGRGVGREGVGTSICASAVPPRRGLPCGFAVGEGWMLFFLTASFTDSSVVQLELSALSSGFFFTGNSAIEKLFNIIIYYYALLKPRPHRPVLGAIAHSPVSTTSDISLCNRVFCFVFISNCFSRVKCRQWCQRKQTGARAALPLFNSRESHLGFLLRCMPCHPCTE